MLGRLFSPRAVAAAWAIFATVTAISYHGASVDALSPVEAIIPAGSPMLAWSVAAVLLAAGAVVPPSPRLARIGRLTRIIGVSIVAALLTMWAASFAIDAVSEGSRMWVSAKNYVMLAAGAMVSGAIMGRNHTSR